MSRGISDLQKGILLLCQEKGFLLTQDILGWWWGWEPMEWGSKKATVGESEYRAAYASLSRTLDRLWRRGLVKIWKSITGPGTGITLTPQGQRIAQAISEEKAEDAING